MNQSNNTDQQLPDKRFLAPGMRLICATIALLFPAFSQAAHGNGKSELVRSLEAMTGSSDFTRIPYQVIDVSEYGAKGDGKTLDTVSIQKAIDAAHAAGGGVVTFKPGTYLTGAIFLKSNIELRIDTGVTIQAVQDDAQYPRLPTRIAGVEMDWPAALINVYEQENVRITGKGVIDGNGSYWWKKFRSMEKPYAERGLRWAVDYDCERVRALVVWKSRNVLLRDVTLQRSGFWTVSLTYSERAHVDGLVIRNNIGGKGPSTDGIDVDSSSRILIENCDIDCHDDNFCLKAGKDADGLRVNRPTERVVIRNCKTGEGMGLFTLGSETSGGIQNIEVYGLKGRKTTSGIRLKSAKVRGGVVRDIYIHDIEMDQVRRPFDFDLNWYPAYSYPKIPSRIPEHEITDRWRKLTERVEPPERGIPKFRDIRLENIRVTNAATAVFAQGYPEQPMRGFVWRNITIQAGTAGSVKHAADWKMDNVTIQTRDASKLEIR